MNDVMNVLEGKKFCIGLSYDLFSIFSFTIWISENRRGKCFPGIKNVWRQDSPNHFREIAGKKLWASDWIYQGLID